MDRMHGLPLTGPGLRALGANPFPPPAPDQVAEPAGFMVAMDGAVRIHFLDWGGPRPAPRDRQAFVPSRTAGGNIPASRHPGGVPGVLLIHGLAQTAWSWAPVARRVRAFAGVVAMDLRGHGLSDAPTGGYDHEQLAEDAIAVAEGAGLLAFADEGGPPARRVRARSSSPATGSARWSRPGPRMRSGTGAPASCSWTAAGPTCQQRRG